MIEIRLHGRGGQGGVTAAELLAQAAISEGNYAQGFPSFGPERRGAPVTAYIRMSKEPIYLREPIDHPDVVVVMDSTLIGLVDVFEGMKPGGRLVINAPGERIEELKDTARGFNLAVVDASTIAAEILGVPITNTAIIGSIVRATSICELASLEQPLTNRFGRLAAKNRTAMQHAFDATLLFGEETLGAVVKDGPYEIDALQTYQELEIGAEIIAPGSSRTFFTGSWRTVGRPDTDIDRCVRCGLCALLCPDVAYLENGEGYYDWDDRYCKGCAICVEACPKDAIQMKGEVS